MNSRGLISGALLAVLVMSGGLMAAPPLRISHLADSTSLSERERQDIRSFSKYWSVALAGENPDSVDGARSKLVEPLRAVRVGDVFRFAYSDALLQDLNGVIDAAKPQSSVAAMQVVSLLGTPRALEILLAHCNIEDQDQFGIRLWAAKGFPIAVKQGVLVPDEINRALRQFGDAASKEKNWLVLRRQLEAIAPVNSNVAREELIGALQAITKRMGEQAGPSDLMQAAYPALILVRDDYMSQRSPVELKAFGTALAPVLCNVCNVANRHWDRAQDDRRARATYGGAIHVSETLLKLIDADVRPRQAGPRTELGPAWKNRKKVQFISDHDKWQAVLSNPPYNKKR